MNANRPGNPGRPVVGIFPDGTRHEYRNAREVERLMSFYRSRVWKAIRSGVPIERIRFEFAEQGAISK